MNEAEAMLDFATGRMAGPPTSVRTLGELAELFASPLGGLDPAQVVYETYGCPSIDAEPAQLLYATTVLHPGRVSGECFMTRGHFHTKPERGEICLTLSGTGVLLLRSRDGKTRHEQMTPGSVHNVDGAWAHRVANVGEEPLTFFVSWMSDCGHDYASIRASGFGLRAMRLDGEPVLVPRIT